MDPTEQTLKFVLIVDGSAARFLNVVHPYQMYFWQMTVTNTIGFTRFTGHEGPEGEERDSSTLFLDLGTRRGWGVSVTPRPLSTPGKDPVPILQEAGWAPGPVWAGAENLAPHRDSISGPSSP
jgi:hypothetical protein